MLWMATETVMALHKARMAEARPAVMPAQRRSASTARPERQVIVRTRVALAK